MKTDIHPQSFENHVPNEIGRALNEQTRKSMKDFICYRRAKEEHETRACARCHPPYNRYDIEDLTPHERYKSANGRHDIYYLCKEHESKYHPYLKGQGDEYRK